MSYLSQSPEVYQYGKGEVITSLNEHYPLYNNVMNSNGSFNRQSEERTQQLPPQLPLNRYGQSQIEAIFFPVQSPSTVPLQPQQTNMNASIQGNRFPTSNQNQINATHNTESTQQRDSNGRFNNYLNSNPNTFKYNLFSAIDEPWNNCMNGKSCICTSGNEIIASQVPSFNPRP